MRNLIAIATIGVALALPAHASIFPTLDADAADRATARADREQSLYDAASDALDDHDYHRAARLFRQVYDQHGAHADAALYWQAYAESRIAMRAEALAHIVALRTEFPKSKWNEDATALEVEVRQSAGEAIPLDRVHDLDLKLITISGLMEADPERALPQLNAIITGPEPEKVKDRALFVLAQSGNPQARALLLRTAKSPNDRLLQRRAIRYIGIMGGGENSAALADVYKSTNDPEIRRSIVNAYVIAGDRPHLLNIAKTERIEALRADAISGLAIAGARTELSQLYGAEQSLALRKKILESLMIGGGNFDRLAEIARNEKNLELKRTAIRNLGLTGGQRSAPALISIYDGDTRPEIRLTVLDALFLQGNVSALRGLQAKETNPELKRSIESKLAIMRH